MVLRWPPSVESDSQKLRRAMGSTPRSAHPETGWAAHAESRNRAPAAVSSRRKASRQRRSRPSSPAMLQARNALAELPIGNAVDAAEEIDVLFHRKIVVERKFLRHVADVPADSSGCVATSKPATLASRGGSAARKACGWWWIFPRHSAQETEDLALARPEGDMIHRHEVAEALHQILQQHRGFISHAPPPCHPPPH